MEAALGHSSSQIPTGSTPPAPIGEALAMLLPVESSAQEALPEGYPSPKDSPNRSMRPRTGKEQTPVTLPSPSEPPMIDYDPRLAIGTTLNAGSFRALAPAPGTPSSDLTSPPCAQSEAKPLDVNNLQLAILSRPKPMVKVCMLITGNGVPVIPDTNLVIQNLGRIPNVNLDHVITWNELLIGTALDEFFDSTGIHEGGMLILIISCHGSRSYNNTSTVLLQFKTQDGTYVDSRMLQEKIMALPKQCTLEVIVDTCCAEGVIPGLHRIFTMDPSAPCAMPGGVPNSAAAQILPSGSYSNLTASVSFDPPKYKAQVVVWAASTELGSSFPEENLPERTGMYSILIGAIFNQLNSNGPNVSRHNVWKNVLEVVERHNDARRKRDLLKPLEKRLKLGNRTQSAVLLTSVGDLGHVLNGRIFQPL